MRKFATTLAAVAVIGTPVAASAQGIGVGAKLGTLGYGVDGGLGLSDKLVVRAGIAFAPEDLPLTDLIPTDISGVDYSLEAPQVTMTAGLDLHLVGPLRLMGGLMYRTENLVARGDVTGSYEIGNTTYTDTGTVWAELEQNSIMPYAGIGIGKLSSSGIGFFLDLAIAYSGDAEIVMTASDNLNAVPGFLADLQVEAQQFADDAGIIKNLYPVLQAGIKIGLGG